MNKKFVALISAKETLASFSLEPGYEQEIVLVTFQDKTTSEKIIVKVHKHLCFYVNNIRRIGNDNVFPKLNNFKIHDECEVELLEHPIIKGSFEDTEPEKMLYIRSIRNVHSGVTAQY